MSEPRRTLQLRPFRGRWIAAVMFLLATPMLALPITALAGEPGGAKTFSAGEPEAKVNPNDPAAMLARCDTMLERCQTDQKGKPYLIGAYLVLWAILVVYFFLTRRGQMKLRAELAELRLRLREYEEAQLEREERA